ncbi:hypothetical protein [Pseudonocardia kongjuensis]|uniref:hypothetical protein n=1 Tax=Pseudonocardia kongjuensis TaxID=102227 RepID=UPI003CD056AA
MEHDGRHHLDPSRARADLGRQQFLTERGRPIHRPDARDVLRRPELVAGGIRRLLAERCRITPARPAPGRSR